MFILALHTTDELNILQSSSFS